MFSVLLGGFDGSQYLNTVETFDPVTRRWHRVASMLQVRRYHALAVLDNQLFAVGGYDGTSVLDSVEAYDPRTNRWCKLWEIQPSLEVRNCLMLVGLEFGTSVYVTHEADCDASVWLSIS